MAPPPKKFFDRNIFATLFLWAFVVLGIGGIVWMIVINPPQKKLNCRATPTTSLIGFGNCTEE